ncbi:MAG TPA: Zn-ribbon domain-containing OB-fold protein [Nitrososphaerales archaeon]|nr:Zn-ribbon domain-containing OB-fold protein [Nitrososphaerales archaeon]
MSSKIPSYPGTEIESSDVAAKKYLTTAYETELRYSWTSGVAISRYLRGLKEGELWGRKCKGCGRTLVPPRMYCEECFRPTDEWVRLQDSGTINTFSISYVNVDASRRTEPVLVAVVDIDGASPGMGILHVLGEVAPADIRVGMKVKAVWKPVEERTGAITDIRYFKPG